jgi:serine protease Do
MKRAFLLASCAGVLVGAFLTAKLLHNRNAIAPPPDIRADDNRTVVGVQTTFAPVVKKVAPAVVNISSTRIIKTAAPGDETGSIDDFFRQFFGGGGGSRGGRLPFGAPQRPTERRASSLGSGVIVSADGYVLTNNHVVEQATSVKVALSDRRELTAKIVGTDPQTDIALLKLDAKGLPNLHMGDSAKVEVGDVALALGNPFGIGQTVTMGIIGAKGRGGLGIEDYEDFIQTDAAINPGNSGGALVNTKGDLIAINTAILSGGGGNQGIGFAIPINMAKEIGTELIAGHKIVRPWLGIRIETLGDDPSIRDLFKGLDHGVVVRAIEADAPANKSDLRPGDVITRVDGAPVTTDSQLQHEILKKKVGQHVDLTVWRKGQTIKIPVATGELPNEIARASNESAPQPNEPREEELGKFGLQVQDLSKEVSERLHLGVQQGVIVTDVAENSIAAQQGIEREDVITEVDGKPVTDVKSFREAINRADPKRGVLLYIDRKGSKTFAVLKATGAEAPGDD